jgi:D-alanyl-D-alanine dipeptidase
VAVVSEPLPPLTPNTGWQEVPIEPVSEPLVAVADLGGRVHQNAAYHRMGLPGALAHCWVRESVGARLAEVAAGLPDGVELLVWDGYRPYEVQKALFDGYVDELIAVHPEMPADAIEAAATRFVSRPSTSPVAPSPHLTGGAVDLTLCAPDGTPLDLGTGFDAFVPEAGAAAFEQRPGRARDNRRTLFWSMVRAGFAAYTEEWWHFDLWDQFWGVVRGRPARFGPADPPEG